MYKEVITTSCYPYLQNASMSVCVSVCPLRYFSALLGQLREFEVPLEQAQQGDSVSQVSHNFTQSPINSSNFMEFWLFQQSLGQFQYVGYKDSYTRAEKFNGDTFTLPPTSCNFHIILAISAIFWPISTCLVSK